VRDALSVHARGAFVRVRPSVARADGSEHARAGAGQVAASPRPDARRAEAEVVHATEVRAPSAAVGVGRAGEVRARRRNDAEVRPRRVEAHTIEPAALLPGRALRVGATREEHGVRSAASRDEVAVRERSTARDVPATPRARREQLRAARALLTRPNADE